MALLLNSLSVGFLCDLCVSESSVFPGQLAEILRV